MNYLAHCYFAQADNHSLVGNLLGDFCKGVNTQVLPVGVYRGLLNHREVDKYTDNHPIIQHAKSLFSQHRRRFAGIAIDVLFDYFLIKHWQHFAVLPFDQYKYNIYNRLEKSYSLMPIKMARVMERVVNQDWFNSYQSLEGIGYSLDRIAARIRFKNHYSGAIDDIYCHLDELENAFLDFFPLLEQHVQQSQLEQNHCN